MNQTPHPDADELSALMRGALEEERSEELLEHVENCEACFAAAEAFWQGRPEGRLSALSEPEPGDLPTLERQVLRRLHATTLGEQATQLASSGFVYVVIGLLAPVLFILSGRPTDRRLP